VRLWKRQQFRFRDVLASVMTFCLRFYRHEPPCTVSIERDARRNNGCSRTLTRPKAINVPEQRFLEITGQRFVLNDAATDLASPLG